MYICILNLKFPGFQLFGIYFGVAITKKWGSMVKGLFCKQIEDNFKQLKLHILYNQLLFCKIWRNTPISE